MQITIKSKNFELTDALKGYAEKKLRKIEKYFDHIISTDIMLSAERSKYIVEVTVYANGVTLRGEEKTDDMYSSVDKVISKLERQLKKHKGKILNRHRAGKVEMERGTALSDEKVKMVRTRKLMVETLNEEEAVFQMEEMGYDFFVFFNIDTNQLNILYRRKDGEYEIIEPVY